MRTFIIALLCMVSLASSAQETGIWLVNLEEAKLQAKAESKTILMTFSGSDWCGVCMRLDQDLYKTAQFLEFAKQNLVLVNMDFPAKKANKLSAEQSTYNDAMAEKFNKEGTFPLALILNEKGELISKLKFPCKNVEEYLHFIQSACRK